MHECPTCGQKCSTPVAEYLDNAAVKIRQMFWERKVHLTVTEAKILALVQGKNRPVSKNRIFEAIYWNDLDGGPDTKIIDVFICKIRPKIKKAGLKWEILTVWGYGYELKESETSPILKRTAASVFFCLALAHPLAQWLG